MHIYLQVMTLLLTTVVFILGWFAVGPNRSLTNPHHGIGVAIYVLVIVQAFGGSWVRGRLRKTVSRRLPIKLMLHQWIGRATALLGIVQVALGLTLYGSPKFTFVLYTLWMTFLLLLYFILSHRASAVLEDTIRYGTGAGGSVISEKKSGGILKFLAPLAAGAGIAALMGRRDKERRDERVEVIPSRRGSRRDSGSYVEEEKYEESDRGGGTMGKVFKAAAVLGVGALAKSWWDNRQRKKEDEEYSAVGQDTPSRRHRSRRGDHSVVSEDSVEVHRVEHGSRRGPLLPGPGDPVLAAAALSAAEPRPVTPRPIGRPVGHSRVHSYDSDDSSIGTPTPSPRKSTRVSESHVVRNGLLGGLGLAWLGSRFKNRREKKEQQRLDDIRAQELEDERRLEADRRHGVAPPRFTGDGIPPPRRNRPRRDDYTESSVFSSDLSDSRVEPRRGGVMPPLAAGAIPAAGAAILQSRSRHDISEPVPMPAGPPRDHVLRTDVESGSEAYISSGGRDHRRHSRREEAAAAAAAAGATLAMEEEHRRRARSGSRYDTVESPPVSIKVTQHNDKDRKVTLRRLTEEEAAAERRTRRGKGRERSASISSLSASETTANRRQYRRDRSARREAAEVAAERRTDPSVSGLDPPRPAFAGGRAAKDSSYYSGTPAKASRADSVGSPGSHGTWSGMSPSGTGLGGDEDAAERRRRRRLERNQRPSGTVDFT